jgi:hypothetical protein
MRSKELKPAETPARSSGEMLQSPRMATNLPNRAPGEAPTPTNGRERA